MYLCSSKLNPKRQYVYPRIVVVPQIYDASGLLDPITYTKSLKPFHEVPYKRYQKKKKKFKSSLYRYLSSYHSRNNDQLTKIFMYEIIDLITYLICDVYGHGRYAYIAYMPQLAWSGVLLLSLGRRLFPFYVSSFLLDSSSSIDRQARDSSHARAWESCRCSLLSSLL